MKKLIIQFCLIFLFNSFYTSMAMAQSEDSAVIIMYHRFGEEGFPTTNIKLSQFDQHIAELSKDKYNIVPLRTIIVALKNKQKLPPRTIAVTIDDGYLSIYKEAWPRLKAAGIPFTLFISTESVNDQNSSSMTWDQIRELDADPLVEIGHHGHAHDHMTEISTDEAKADIEEADKIYQRELGYIPDIFAYPYGEFSESMIEIAKSKNYEAAFAQYSSAANSRNEIMTLPRFAFNENYADIDRFKLIINSRALPVRDILPRTADLDVNPPSVGFTVDDNIKGLGAMNCFPSHIDKAARINLIATNRVEVRFDEPFPPGRSRINCTMPGPDGRWYWFGMPFFRLNNVN